jgi:hypothetical protein
MLHGLEDYTHIEEELVALLNELLAGLPPNAATLEVMRAPPQGDGVVAKLKPKNPAAASIVVHAENGFALVDFSFGDDEPTWELPYEGSNSKPNKQELLREVEQMCRAVIAGRCQHNRGLLNVSGTIQVSDRPSTVTLFFILRPTPPFKGTRKYESYIDSD